MAFFGANPDDLEDLEKVVAELEERIEALESEIAILRQMVR